MERVFEEFEGLFGSVRYQEISSGAFARVYRAESGAHPPHVVKRPNELNTREMYQREISILQVITQKESHSNVIRCFGWHYSNSSFLEKTHLAFEYADSGDLQSYLDKHAKNLSALSQKLRYNLLLGIAEGLDYLHTKCLIVHLDLKIENIALHRCEGRIVPKIIDFGFAERAASPDAVIYDVSPRGTYAYCSPELLSLKCCSSKSDIYAFAIIMYAMAYLRTPLGNFLEDNFLPQVKHGLNLIQNGIREDLYDFIPNEDREMIHDAWAPNPDDRPTARQIADHLAFVLKNFDLSSQSPIYVSSRSRRWSSWQPPRFGIFDKHSSSSPMSEIMQEEAENGCLSFF